MPPMKFSLLVFALFLMMLAWPAAAQPPTPNADGNIIDLAPVRTVDVMGESVVVSGDLPDGCTSILDYEMTTTDDEIAIVLRTLRPADLMCTMALAPYTYEIPLEISTPGAYTISVNGVSTAALLDTITAQAADDPCPVADDDHVTFRNIQLGYCLLVPRSAQISGQYPTPMIFNADMIEDVRPAVLIAVANAQGNTIDEIMTTMLVDNDEADVEEISIGGEAAVVVTNLPGRTGNWQGFVVANDLAYRVILQPVEPESLPEATAAAQEIWTVITESMVFFPPVLPALEDIETTVTALTRLGLQVILPVDWAFTEAGAAYVITPPGYNAEAAGTPYISFRPVTGTNAQTDLIDLTERRAAGYSAETVYDRVIVGTQIEGTVIYAAAGLCREVLIPTPQAVILMTISPAACGAPNSIVITDPIVQAIVQSIRIAPEAQ